MSQSAEERGPVWAWSELQVLWALLGCRILVGFLHAVRPVSSPHTWRQVDTLATSFRYWQRWSLGHGEGWRVLIPSVLNSGDAVGYMPMEFPFLNAVAAPAFAFGIVPGRTLAHLVALGLLLALLAANMRVWRGVAVAGVAAEKWLLLLPCFSFAAGFFVKFMPDVSAMLAVLLGVGLVWQRPRPALAFCAATLGMLMKPTAAPVLLLLALHPRLKTQPVARLLPLAAAVGAAGAYYTLGIHGLRLLQDGPARFAVDPRPPLRALAEFFAEPKKVLDLLNYHAFVPWAAIAVAVALLAGWRRLDRSMLLLSLCVVAQIVTVAALDGAHSFVHVYYFMALVPTLALIALKALQTCRPAWIRGLFWLLLASRVVETSANDLQGYRRGDDPPRALFAECTELKRWMATWPWNQGAAFRSSSEAYPMLGLCFGEREASATSPYGFFYKDQPLPSGCRAAVSGDRLLLAECDGGRVAE